MEPTKYLRDKSYYEELYDHGTVFQCRRTEEVFRRIRDDKLKENPKFFDDPEAAKAYLMMKHMAFYFQTGERYCGKEEVVQKWMDKDRKKDLFLQTEPPLVFCSKCNDQMKLIIKDLKTNLDDTEFRVLFLFRCEKCKEKRGIYDNGEEYVFESDFCPKCRTKWDSSSKKEKDKITTKHHCKNCGHKEVEVFDLTKPKSKVDEEQDLNFEKDKAKYCLSEKNGQEYIDYKPKVEQMKQLVDEWKYKEKHKEIYDKVKNMKKLTVAELSEILSKTLEKENYKGLMISNPEIGRDLIVSFNIQDAKIGRVEYDSKKYLKKSIETTLENTNWRLMSDGLDYRLGILTGRLRGYELEEDLLKIVSKPN